MKYYGNDFKGVWGSYYFRMAVMKFVNCVANWATRHGIPFYVTTWYNINDGFTPERVHELAKQYLEYRNYKEEQEGE